MDWKGDEAEEAVSNPKADLHPWSVILGVISGLNNSDIVVDVINRSGLQVAWPAPGYSHTTRIRDYIPLIQAAYAKLSEDKQLAVASLVIEDFGQWHPKAYEEVKSRIERIGWKVESGHLLPGNLDIQEMFFPSGSEHDAYKEIRAILQTAKASITIIDPYVDGTLFQLLSTHSGAAVNINILSSKLPADFSLRQKSSSSNIHIFNWRSDGRRNSTIDSSSSMT